ncbi:4Fe-4S binding protein [Fusibacter paucivorans]|uniref:4Fe-4S binding protein n=1 Tax=Fusibacter paucivorans TaxID=76009 RepID=A0ABS5PL74_9FIRM|nr:4Fe-4S binding protein [Fusibacter paucivorans]MBS7525657.1 4Fe-4S binding protein [Fusibacter paucivorans]
MAKKVAVIDANRCDRSPFCPVKRVCPVNAVKANMYGVPEVNQSECIGCGKCLRYCPMRAVTMVELQ